MPARWQLQKQQAIGDDVFREARMMKLFGAVTIVAIGCVLLPATSLATSDVAHQ